MGSVPAHAEAFEEEVAYVRLRGHELPRIGVIEVCARTEEWPERGLSPKVAAMDRGIVGRVPGRVKNVIREAKLNIGPFEARRLPQCPP